MKKIYLVRHGKAESGSVDAPDFKRVLIERGKDNSLQVARRMKKNKIKPSLILSSPAPRAFATARIFANQLKYNPRSIKSRKALYDQEESALLDIVHSIDDKLDCIMFVGHNPSMEELAQFFTGGFKEAIPTSGVVGITFKSKTWKEISRGKGKLKLFVFPKPEKKSTAMKNTLKNLQKELEMKLTKQIGSVLEKTDPSAKGKIEKFVTKSSKKLAKTFIKQVKTSK